jgi:hypothetical protein
MKPRQIEEAEIKARVTSLEDFFRECLDYNPDTGDFRWKSRPSNHFSSDTKARQANSCFTGTTAGSVGPQGYVSIKVSGILFRAHRIAWLLIYGEWPKSFIDHVDGNPSNNRIGNLRLATPSQNSMNSRMRSDNRSGVKGVGFHLGRWRVRVMLNGVQTFHGRFAKDQKHLAEAAAVAARLSLHSNFANHGTK